MPVACYSSSDLPGKSDIGYSLQPYLVDLVAQVALETLAVLGVLLDLEVLLVLFHQQVLLAPDCQTLPVGQLALGVQSLLFCPRLLFHPWPQLVR